MKFKPTLIVFSTLIFTLFSCSVVKNPSSANFNRVKYNSHLKFAKADKKEKLPNTIQSFNEKTEVQEHNTAQLEKAAVNGFDYKSLVASSTKERTALKAEKIIDENINVEPRKPLSGLFSNESSTTESTINSYLNKPLAVDSDLALGDVLYVLLVLLAILVIVSIIGEFAGGLIGLLIALLLILLLLRLLGIA
jgi:hypothetical protein